VYAWHRSFQPTPVLAIGVLLFLSCGAAARADQGPVPPTPAPASASPSAAPTWLRLRVEFRERMEDASHIGFVTGRDDAYWLSRVRVNAAITPSRVLSFQVQAQDARVADKEIGATGTPFSAALDIRTAFADAGSTSSHVSVRVGRQELVYGEQRLIGHANWTNAARTFDAGRVTLRGKRGQIDLFAASVVRILPGEWDKSGNGNRLYGAYATTTTLVPAGVVEPYVFWREDRGVAVETGGTGHLRQATTGVRLAGTLPRKIEYGVEAAMQRGSLATDAISAWASHAQIRTPVIGPALRLIGEYNFASGDASPTDGRRGTFDQLYPTPHDKYGLADQVGWRNIHHLRAGIELAHLKAWPVSAAYHSWWLADAHDGLYVAGGGLLARIPSGASSRHVGQELDLQISHPLTPQLQVAAGYAHIFPGGFLDQATPGASYNAPFVMLSYAFATEKKR
jgi:hypothetical protein